MSETLTEIESLRLRIAALEEALRLVEPYIDAFKLGQDRFQRYVELTKGMKP